MEEYHGDLETKLVLNLIFCKSFKICVLSIDWLISHELAKKMLCGKKYGRVWSEKERERGISTPQAFSGIHPLVAILLWRAQGHDMNWQAF
jgi:hypothetical protein